MQIAVKSTILSRFTMPINCEIYRDKSQFRRKSAVSRKLLVGFFPENRDKIVRTDDFFEDENIITKSGRILMKEMI